jgi:hypothetical protein
MKWLVRTSALKGSPRLDWVWGVGEGLHGEVGAWEGVFCRNRQISNKIRQISRKQVENNTCK